MSSLRVAIRESSGYRSVQLVEWVLLISGLVLLGSYGKRQLFSHIQSQQALNEFRSSQLQSVGDGMRPADFSLWSPGRIDAYRKSFGLDLAPPIGILRIRKIHLEVPIFDGTDDVILDRGVGRIIGTSLPGENGNVGIAGHRDGFFRGLKDIGPGDDVELIAREQTQIFAVEETVIVDPSNVEVLRPSNSPTITLVTCYPFYFVGHAPQRYIVKAALHR